MVQEIVDEAEFHQALETSSTKLVLVDFYASWCGPCLRIAPFIEELAAKYPDVSFCKIDVDKCQDVAISQSVSAMPTFHFFKNRQRIDTVEGADARRLEDKIKLYVRGEDESGVPGLVDLESYVTRQECEALNQSDEHPLINCLTAGNNYLLSDSDEQLIINLSFSQVVKLHSMRIKAPADIGPRKIKVFINQPNTLDFNEAAANKPVQIIEIPKEALDGEIINLRYVKLQNVQNLQLFIEGNQSGSDVTRIDHIQLFGAPMCTTNMKNFKRIAGKQGESH